MISISYLLELFFKQKSLQDNTKEKILIPSNMRIDKYLTHLM